MDVSSTDGVVRVLFNAYGGNTMMVRTWTSTKHTRTPICPRRDVGKAFGRPAGACDVRPTRRSRWKPATQLFPGDTPWTFTAPNLHYLFDSPTELSAYALREFTVRNPDGKTYTIRAAVHSGASAEEVDWYAAGLEKIVNEARDGLR